MRRRERPAHVARRFASRLTRALPLDEVLLQLVEVARSACKADGAEVWVSEAPGVTKAEGADGVELTLGAAVPWVALPALGLSAAERDVLLAAMPRGHAWLTLWLPPVAVRFADRPVCFVPMVHQGVLLGALIVWRNDGRAPFSDRDELVLADLARQTAVALHNASLDSALSETVEELQRTNRELVRSRSRIVATADAERRRLERDLHDGAQQHLVTVSVKVLLARQAVERGDAEEAIGLLDELKSDAALALSELRALAHGLYPAELAGGLSDALSAVAARAPMPVTVNVTTTSRFDPSIEACCYFCCAEAVANVAKHAGPSAAVIVDLSVAGGALCLQVSDDGVGIDAFQAPGHGLQNMADRAGALGGSLVIGPSSPCGTTVQLRLPIGELP
ncbi:MAG: histidine kinase [Acidimicrobiia bacterium]